MSPFLNVAEHDEKERDVTLKDVWLFKALLPYMKPHWKLLALSGLLLPLVSVTQVLQPVIIRQAIDGPVAQGDWPALGMKVLFFLGLLASHYALRYGQMVLAQMTGQRIILSLRTALYDHLQSLPLSFYHKTPLGKLVTRLSSDVENISEVFASGGVAIFSDIAIILGILVAMSVMSLPLALVTMAIIPVVIVTMEFFRRRSRLIYNEMRVQLAQMNSQLQETLTGVDVIQLLRREKAAVDDFSHISKAYMNTNVRSVIYDSSFTASVEVLSLVTLMLILGLVALMQGGIWGQAVVTFGVLIAFLQYNQMLFEPIEEISDKFTIIQSGLASLEKIMELMSIQPDIVSPENPRSMGRSKGHIRFVDVTFGYSKQVEPVLSNLSLEIAPGEKIAIIGPSGAGKSTIIKLLNRQYMTQAGRIELDGIDIASLSLSQLRQNIVVIPQDEFLFSRSIQENMTLTYKSPIDLAHLKKVAKTVHADTVVDRFPETYHAILPERGRNLSNGERQLLVFARALWHNPAIIVLDEATSSVDPQTESLLQDALEKSLEGRTAIIIAHRLSTIRKVDRVYVIQQGAIVKCGSPEAILGDKAIYQQYLQPTEPSEDYNLLHP